MSNKTASIKVVSILAIPPRINLNDLSQLSLQVPVTEATCLRNQPLKTNIANQAKAAQSLRMIAHLLMSGSLSLLMAFSCEFRQQINESYSTLPERSRSERVL